MKAMYPKKGRVILHVDANSYYASVEEANDPTLKNKAVAVAGNPHERKGIVLTCNYIAREYGLYTTMPLWEAKKRCPHLIVRKPNFELYRETSRKMFRLLSNITPVLEPVSIDEGYLDITACHHLGSPVAIAKKLQADLLKKINIPVSIGIAPNKFLAKTASDMKKPLGITVLRKRDIQSVLWNEKVEKMHGIGKKTAEKLASIGIITIGDLAQADSMALTQALGINGVKMKDQANGNDERPVDPDATRKFKSISQSTTLPKNLAEEHALLEIIHRLSGAVCKRMRQKEVVSQNIQVTIRYGDFKTMTRSQKLPSSISEHADIYTHASHLFRKHWNGKPVRLLGVTALDVTNKKEAFKQLDLFTFEEEAKLEPLLNAVDQVKEKYGDASLQTGADLIAKNRSTSKE